MSLTRTEQPNILNPYDGLSDVLAYAPVSNFCLFHRCIPAKELFLNLPQGGTRLHQIDRLDG